MRTDVSGGSGVVDRRGISVIRLIDVDVELVDERLDELQTASRAGVVDRFASAAVQAEAVRQLDAAAAVDERPRDVEVSERDGDVERRRAVVEHTVHQRAHVRRQRAQRLEDRVHLHSKHRTDIAKTSLC